MAHFPLLNCTIILDKYSISGDTNSVVLNRSQEPLSNDTFDPSKTFMARMGGLQDGIVSLAGLVELTDEGQDEIFNARMSLANQPLLLTLITPVEGTRAKFGSFMQGQYQSGGGVGQRAEFSANGRISTSALVDGLIGAVGVKTGTFNGGWLELGAVSATQKLYATLHATAKTVFTSAVFKVQSADDAGGTNTTDRITFTTVTDLTSQFATPVSGSISQTFWRITCSAFTGTNLTVYSAIGIS